MRVAVFFVCLCILLIRGYDYIYTGLHYNNIYYHLAQNLEGIKQVHTNQSFTFIKATNLDEEDEFLITDDVEDEDGNDFLERKYKLLGNRHQAVSYPFVLNYLYKSVKAPPPIWSYLSYKYITQGVLRV
jgi:hypothetical protein